MEGEKVGGRQHLVEVGQLHLGVPGHPLAHEWVIGHDRHVESLGSSGDRPPDPAQADHSQHLAPQLGAGKIRALPFAVGHVVVSRHHVAGRGQQQGHGVFGGGGGVGLGRVHDDDASASGGIDVDVVRAHTGPANDP